MKNIKTLLLMIIGLITAGAILAVAWEIHPYLFLSIIVLSAVDRLVSMFKEIKGEIGE